VGSLPSLRDLEQLTRIEELLRLQTKQGSAPRQVSA
jgi:hypothetical protein